jgi:hypothetical protein
MAAISDSVRDWDWVRDACAVRTNALGSRLS